jgi:hypothetical protein
MEITDAGNALFRRAKEALLLANDGFDAARAVGSGSRGRLTVGTMIVLSYLVLPRLENELRLRLPEVEVQYVELNAVNNVSALTDSDVSGRDDGLGIGAGPGRQGRGDPARLRPDWPAFRRGVQALPQCRCKDGHRGLLAQRLGQPAERPVPGLCWFVASQREKLHAESSYLVLHAGRIGHVKTRHRHTRHDC